MLKRRLSWCSFPFDSRRPKVAPRFLNPFLAGLLTCLLTLGCGSISSHSGLQGVSPNTVRITVSAAASIQNVLEALTPQFQESHPNITVDYNFASSGALQRQIEQGAPVDLFFSAAVKQMETLTQKGFILPDSLQNLVTNSLALIAPKTSSLEQMDLAQLRETEISHFAVGEFRSVPAGQYAQQVFESLGLLLPLKSKFVFGNNVRSVLSAVESGNADLGMVYATDAALSEQVKVLAFAPEGSHTPILYPIAVINGSPHARAAQTFIQFLTTETAKNTFEEFGFASL